MRLLPLCALAAVLCLSGCNQGGPPRVVVVGSVNLANAPVQDGQIRFIPQGDTAGPLTIAPIKNGQYRCEINGGVPIGDHRVEIRAWDPTVPPPSGPGGTPRPQWAPEKYNKNSTLTARIDEADEPLVRDFNL